MLLENNPLINKIRFYFSFLMVLIYLAFGSVFLFSDIAIQTFPVYREPIGGLLIVYACFRLYSIIKKNKENK
jgi:hypothetical protein